jgi:hypothetical protein
MRKTSCFRSLLGIFALATTAASLTACGSKEAEVAGAEAEVSVEAEATLDTEAAVTEEHEAGTVTWAVAPEGKVRALVKLPDGTPAEKETTGKLMVKASADVNAEPVIVDVSHDVKSGLIIAEIPKLEADLTEVKYELSVKGKPVIGILHLPPGGTKEIVLSAKASVDVKVPEGKGPNGGVIQVVGDDTVEIVAHKPSGQVRVYILGPDFKPVVVGERKVKLAVVGSASETLVLAPEPSGFYFTGRLSLVASPARLTVAVTKASMTRVALVGYRPGAVFVVGARAPSLNIFVGAGVHWDVDVDARSTVIVHDDDDDDGGHRHGKTKIHIHEGGHGHAYGHDKVGLHAKAGGHAKAGVHVNAGASFKASAGGGGSAKAGGSSKSSGGSSKSSGGSSKSGGGKGKR